MRNEILFEKPNIAARSAVLSLLAESGLRPEREPDETETGLFTGEDGHIGKQPVLISYNKAYRPIHISPELDFKIIGKVL